MDDFGFRRGNGSATIMVDLERHKIVDILEGHSTELIARWLGQRPSAWRWSLATARTSAGKVSTLVLRRRGRSPTAGTYFTTSPRFWRISC
ncbi:MAG: transposase [Rubrobacteraceae bacterium]|nr:transposase [Rubrobacteraceae bacterium]